jgi:hypothetical protein
VGSGVFLASQSPGGLTLLGGLVLITNSRKEAITFIKSSKRTPLTKGIRSVGFDFRRQGTTAGNLLLVIEGTNGASITLTTASHVLQFVL